MTNATRFTAFIEAMTALADAGADEARWMKEGRALLAGLVAQDDWLPEDFAVPGPTYRQYLLHRDPQARFSVVSFVWGPGQRTPIHNHTVWGLIGMLRGTEVSTPMRHGTPMVAGTPEHLRPGEVVGFIPDENDIHKVANALADRVSITIQVYGGDIGAVERHIFDPATGVASPFVSGYSALGAV